MAGGGRFGLLWRIAALLVASSLYGWAVFHFAVRRTYARPVFEAHGEAAYDAAIDALLPAVEVQFWMATGLYVMVWAIVVLSLMERPRIAREGCRTSDPVRREDGGGCTTVPLRDGSGTPRTA